MPDPVEKPDDEQATQVAEHEKVINEDAAEPGSILADFKGTPPDAESKPDDAPETAEVKGETGDETPAAQTDDPFDTEILSIAADCGISETEARGFSSLHELEEKLLELSSSTEEAKPEPEPEKKEDAKPEPVPIRLEAGDELDDELVGKLNAVLDKLGGRYDERTKALEAQLEAIESRQTAQQQQSENMAIVQQFDAVIAQYGETDGELMGKGETFSFDRSSKEWTNRGKVLDEMRTIAQLATQANRPIPGDEQLYARAMREVFPDRSPEKSDNGKVEERRGQFLRRSSSKASAAPTKRERAMTELDEKLAALGGGDG